MHADFDFWNTLFDIIVLLGTGMIFGGVCVRLRQSPLVGYILAGMLLGGPGSIKLVRSEAEVISIAELGVSLLLFELGLEFSFKHFRALGLRVIAGGAVQVAASAAAAAAAFYFIGRPVLESLVFGILIAFSSTAAVVRMLADNREIESPHGRTAIGVLLVQDLAVVLAAVLIALLGGSRNGLAFGEELLHIGLLLVLFVAGLYIIISKTAVSFLRALRLEQSRELTVLLAITTGLGSTWAAHAIGVSPALGAFAAGLFLAETPFAVQIRADVAPLQVVLLSLFFGSVGMLADFIWIVGHWELVLVVTILLLAGKTVLGWLSLSLMGVHSGVALAAAISISQIGEFSFVLGKTAQDAGLISAETFSLVLSSAVIMLLLTPLLINHATEASAWLYGLIGGRQDAAGAVNPGAEAPPPPGMSAVIVGFGPAGQAVGRVLSARRVPTCVIDLSDKSLMLARQLGFKTIFGDARQDAVLQAARIPRFNLVVVAIPTPRAALRIVEQVRRLAPHAMVFVRSRYQRYSEALRASGVHMLVDEEECAGEKLALAVEAVLPPPLGAAYLE